MEIIRRQATLKGTIEEFLEEFLERGDDAPRKADKDTFKGDIQEALAGEAKIRPNFRIAVPGRGEFFFNQRELLCRWATLPTPVQESFVNALRAAFKDRGVAEIELNIRWSTTSRRRLRIEGGPTIFDLNLI